MNITPTIPDLHTIKSDAFIGGMGHVYRVHHKEWKVDMAMKQALRRLFQTEEQKERFKKECKHWIDLGLIAHKEISTALKQFDQLRETESFLFSEAL